MNKYAGECFCGSVKFTVSGDPEAMGYCHCASCRHWSAGPVNAFSLWKPDAVKITSGEINIASFQKSPNSIRKWCNVCGGHLLTEHPTWGLVDVYVAVLPRLPFKPALHVNYQETILPMHDGLPKQRDFPKELGGSGEVLSD
jgi:hypothetical protein